MQLRALVVLVSLLTCSLVFSQTIDLSGGKPVTLTKIGKLASGGRQRFTVRLPQAMSLELAVPFTEAPFNGTQLNATINGRRLLPYFAFGGDLRYESVKGKPGMRPPVAIIEGRWVIPAGWLRAGNNELILWTTGVRKDAVLARLGPKPAIRMASVRVAPLDGTQLPTYANSVYYDFSVWPQGYPWGDEPNRLNYDLALLGVINGKGMPSVTPPIGAPESSIWEVKRQCEDNALGWGMGHQEFYTIWEFASKPDAWAKFVDADNNPETTAHIHTQTLYEQFVPKGTDYVLYDTEKYVAALEPAVRLLAPYTDFYNFKCEQHAAWGQGFGEDGERLKHLGIHGDLWARNHYEANKAARDLVRKYNPEHGRVQEMHHWFRGIRPILYDTALKRNQPMGDVIDILMTHFDLMEENDRGPDGLSVKENAFNKQYPYPENIRPREGAGTSGNRFPEVALDFNRYRLSRTEKDMKLGDPKVHRWGNGQPFDYRAGFRGDEMMYNSENGIWRTGYAGPAPYQFLQGLFSYSLLPTGASEPRDMKITVRKSLTETEDLPVRRYGEWVDGVGGTKRLRTVDPLYGDMFGWTGSEHCNFGDYISMVGIKEPHHRLPPHDAFGLVRRMCYAFVTTGPVVPAQLNPGSSDQLFVKALVQTFNYQQYIGLYAANFTDKAQKLDVTLPVTVPAGTQAILFNDRAWDWQASARPLPVPADGRFTAQVPALGAWLVLIPVSPQAIAATYQLPITPIPIAPALDAAVDEPLTFRFKTLGGELTFLVEIARETLFRPQDRVTLIQVVNLAFPRDDAHEDEASYTLTIPLTAQTRYFWRVSAVDKQGRRSPWSAPGSFIYRWPEYAAKAFPPQGPTPMPAAKRLDDPGNLAWQGEIWGTGGHMHSPTRAIDGQEFSYWTNGMNEESNNFGMPAEWCVIWPKPATVSTVKIQWFEELMPLAFTLQIGDDGKTWTDLYHGADNIGTTTEFTLPQPTAARYFRILIPRTKSENGAVGIREVFLR